MENLIEIYRKVLKEYGYEYVTNHVMSDKTIFNEEYNHYTLGTIHIRAEYINQSSITIYLYTEPSNQSDDIITDMENSILSEYRNYKLNMLLDNE